MFFLNTPCVKLHPSLDVASALIQTTKNVKKVIEEKVCNNPRSRQRELLRDGLLKQSSEFRMFIKNFESLKTWRVVVP